MVLGMLLLHAFCAEARGEGNECQSRGRERERWRESMGGTAGGEGKEGMGERRYVTAETANVLKNSVCQVRNTVRPR